MGCCGRCVTSVQAAKAEPLDTFRVACLLPKAEIKEWPPLASASNSSPVTLAGVTYPEKTIRFVEFDPGRYDPATQTFDGHFVFDKQMAKIVSYQTFHWLAEKCNAHA